MSAQSTFLIGTLRSDRKFLPPTADELHLNKTRPSAKTTNPTGNPNYRLQCVSVLFFDQEVFNAGKDITESEQLSVFLTNRLHVNTGRKSLLRVKSQTVNNSQYSVQIFSFFMVPGIRIFNVKLRA